MVEMLERCGVFLCHAIVVCRLLPATLGCVSAVVSLPSSAAAGRQPDQSNFDRSVSLDGLRGTIGPGVLLFDTGASIRIAGVLADGASVGIDPNPTVIVQMVYRRRHLGVAFTGGVPPLATVDGAGTLKQLGALGRIRYGPAVLTGRYYPKSFGRFQPYTGAGPVFLFVFKNQDGAIQNLNVRNSIGAAVQLGADYHLSRHWALYLDAKRALLRTDANANLSGLPVQAHIRLDPTVLSAGLSYKF